MSANTKSSSHSKIGDRVEEKNHWSFARNRDRVKHEHSEKHISWSVSTVPLPPKQ